MHIKPTNEITVKVTSSKKELISILESKNFTSGRTFSLNDYYFIPNNLDINNTSTREILAKAIIVRDIFENNEYIKKITYKIKNFDDNGNILNQKSINCNITNIEEAKDLLTAIGYKEIMNIKENNVVYSKNKLELAVKEVINGDILIEVETEPNTEFDTIDKLKLTVSNLEIPILPNEFFIKKAEIELNKILNRN